MALETRRTSLLLGSLAIIFLVIIIILAIVSNYSSTPERLSHDTAKARPLGYDIETTTTPPTTSVTTSSTTSTVAVPAATTKAPTTTASTTTDVTTNPTTSTDDTTTSVPTYTTTPATTSTVEDIVEASTTTAATTTDTSTVNIFTTTDTTTTSATTSTVEDISEVSTTSAATTTDTSTINIFTTTDSTTTPATTSTVDDISEASTTFAPTTTITTTTDDALIATDATTTITTTTDATTTITTTTDATTTITTTTDATTTTPTIMTTSATTSEDVTSASTTLSTNEPSTSESTTAATTTITTLGFVDRNETCQSHVCKSVAADILAVMDHSHDASPCQDFYQYACGGAMRKPHIQARQAATYAQKKILDQLTSQTSKHNPMRTFYESCLEAYDKESRKDLRDFFQYKFEEAALTSGETNTSLTDIFSFMMNAGFMPFFSTGIEVNLLDGKGFLMKLYPALPGSPFSKDLAREVCLAQHTNNIKEKEGSYDVNEEYISFTKCVRTGDGLEARLRRMREAVMVFKELMDDVNPNFVEELLDHTINQTREFMIDLSDALPDIPTLTRNLANKNCNKIQVDDLLNSAFDWSTVMGIDSHIEIQVYMESTINDIQTKIYSFNSKYPADMINILLMLWSERLYTDFVRPVDARVGEEQYCLNTAIALMEEFASYLYLSTIPQEEKDKMQMETKKMMENIVRVGRDFILRRSSSSKAIEKLNNMEEVTTPGFMDLPEISISENFLENSISLLYFRNDRIHEILEMETTDTWWKLMRPYDTFGVYNFPMNKIMVPFGAQEPLFTYQGLPDYLKYAGFGHMLSHLIWHGYDSRGMQIHLTEDEGFTNEAVALKYQYEVPRTYLNPSGLQGNYTMTNVSLNEVLADIRATPLAWEAYLYRNEVEPTDAAPTRGSYTGGGETRRRRSIVGSNDEGTKPEKPLPWLGLSIKQLYYLYWAQQYCNDNSELDMLTLMESTQPPGIVRVNFVIQNDDEFNEAFKCLPK